MLKKILLIGLALLAAFLGYVATRSPDYAVSRAILIQASPAEIFPYLNSAKLGQRWGTWLESDPDTRMTYSGPEFGVGSRASWEGGKKLGTGSATIVESVARKRVVTRLEHVKPMSMTQVAEYLVEPAGDQTQVTWKVSGENPFFGRLMCVFVDMDREIGGMFEKGLSNLKKLVEEKRSSK